MIGAMIFLKFRFFDRANPIQSADYKWLIDECFWDFSSNSTFVGSLNEQEEEWNAIVNTLTREVNGSYLLLGVVADQSPFIGAAINLEWLCTQIDSLETIKQKVSAVADNWLSESSIFKLKYRLFQQEYFMTTQKQLLKKNYFFQFLYDFIVDIQINKVFKEPQNFKIVEFRKIQEIEKELVKNIEIPIIPVREMARMAGMSVSKFKLLFFEIYGESPHQYILDKKLLYARKLLQTGQYSITQIAYKLGYNHPSGFTRIYKKKFNSPPSEI
ncbi:helix-turn-helix transcriptional regulator [Spirosoma pollinicola]|uniref:HTH araC/xylS-type domain-containing protein n=1 Tax=Spirosoma pollinicola TaxID=2057025 RepID=A0A2K8YYD4_9BACT|nr:helix-turn-helix transcriptional regulator [Spirosoma pollinicola]AUD02646.1 hypothetical protein CWM47_12855 [Spirosoma pollinicola]